MADQPRFMEDEDDARPILAAPRITGTPRALPRVEDAARPRSFLATLDYPLLIVVGLLLGIGSMMVYSTTFDWSFQDWGSETYMLGLHLRNMAIGGVILVLMLLIDYRVWRRIALWFLVLTVSFLIGVMLFGDTTFGARRALIAGSYQPGELAELAIVLYMAAWMSSKTTRLNSFFYGMIPFAMLVGGMCLLLLLQPDLSTAFLIFTSTTVMFFLAGANLRHLLIAGIAAAVLGVVMAQSLPYAQERVESFRAGISDLTRANYHVQQAIVAFRNGGWTGVGLGEGSQKFGFLPAPHTDSIFAVIGEELGLLGAGFIVLLYVAFGIRGFITARRAVDPFGALLAAGVTVWVIIQALLNIAVMTAVVPATGVPLPFISYGGSSLVVMMTGVGLLLSIHRVAVRQQSAPERRNHAPYDSGRRDGGARVPGAGGGRTSG